MKLQIKAYMLPSELALFIGDPDVLSMWVMLWKNGGTADGGERAVSVTIEYEVPEVNK